MKHLRNIAFTTLIVIAIILSFIPALFSLVLEEVAHKKGDEQE